MNLDNSAEQTETRQLSPVEELFEMLEEIQDPSKLNTTFPQLVADVIGKSKARLI